MLSVNSTPEKVQQPKRTKVTEGETNDETEISATSDDEVDRMQ